MQDRLRTDVENVYLFGILSRFEWVLNLHVQCIHVHVPYPFLYYDNNADGNRRMLYY